MWLRQLHGWMEFQQGVKDADVVCPGDISNMRGIQNLPIARGPCNADADR